MVDLQWVGGNKTGNKEMLCRVKKIVIKYVFLAKCKIALWIPLGFHDFSSSNNKSGPRPHIRKKPFFSRVSVKIN
jgi:hypothetical protein